jgi:inorganic triphosphatase YgiF
MAMELELKFALPLADSAQLEKTLARVALIGRRRPKRQSLHNTYYDNSAHALHALRVALRVRQVGEAHHPRWLQTLKVGGTADSALSQRGEWETPIESAQLSLAPLANTPWAELDPQGALFASLLPVFTTRFERLSWTVDTGEACVEIALDRGTVQMDGRHTPLCELEIELLSGTPDALFEVAGQISQHLCLLPLHLSKAERAYHLARGTLFAPRRAQPPLLSAAMELPEIARSVLREAFLQFTANLYSLHASDAPEVLHQARVGWRRFKSALKLFKQDSSNGLPTLTPLQDLLSQMAALRDLEVAAYEVLPAFAAAYQDGDATRGLQWQHLQAALEQDHRDRRAALQQALSEPAVGHCLVQLTRWLELHDLAPACRTDKAGTGGNAGKAGVDNKAPSAWLHKRIKKLADALKPALRHGSADAAAQHRLRILSKRLRYSVEGVRVLLPAKRAERWHRLATETQTRIGLERDSLQAIATAQRLRACDGIVGFLRGAAFAARHPVRGIGPY